MVLLFYLAKLDKQTTLARLVFVTQEKLILKTSSLIERVIRMVAIAILEIIATINNNNCFYYSCRLISF